MDAVEFLTIIFLLIAIIFMVIVWYYTYGPGKNSKMKNKIKDSINQFLVKMRIKKDINASKTANFTQSENTKSTNTNKCPKCQPCAKCQPCKK